MNKNRRPQDQRRNFQNQDVIQNLPPGVASDRDIAIAQEGWPPPNANASYLAAFMRGVQKMKVLTYAKAMHENAFISSGKSMRFMGQDWVQKQDAYTLEALKANGLRVDVSGRTDWSADQLRDYADQSMTQILTTGTYPSAGSPQIVQPGATAPPQPGAQPSTPGYTDQDFQKAFDQYGKR